MNNFKMIYACDKENGIGKDNKLPWKCQNDMNYFQEKTIGNGNNCVIMGSNTAKSIPKKFFPLRKRINIILSKTLKYEDLGGKSENVIIFENLYEIFNYLSNKKYEENWIIGGKTIYDLFLKEYLNRIDEIHITTINNSYNCDIKLDINDYKIEQNGFELVKRIIYFKNTANNPSCDINIYRS